MTTNPTDLGTDADTDDRFAHWLAGRPLAAQLATFARWLRSLPDCRHLSAQIGWGAEMVAAIAAIDGARTSTPHPVVVGDGKIAIIEAAYVTIGGVEFRAQSERPAEIQVAA